MVEISLSGSGEGSGWVTAPGYSTAGFPQHGPSRTLSGRPNSGAIWPDAGRLFHGPLGWMISVL